MLVKRAVLGLGNVSSPTVLLLHDRLELPMLLLMV